MLSFFSFLYLYKLFYKEYFRAGGMIMKKNFLLIYRIALIVLTNLIVILSSVYVYKVYYDKLPGTIILETKKEQVLSYNLPIRGSVYLTGEDESIETSSEAISELDFNSDVTLVASRPQNYIIKTKLFGFIPFKSVDVSVVDEVNIIPIGVPVGIYANTDGLLVVQTGEFENEDGTKCSPCKKVIFPGDYILEVNGVALESKYQLVSMIEACEGKSQTLTIERDEQIFEVEVLPKENEAGEYKLGIWVKDNAQGIGTLTYVTSSGEFGALGHGIVDLDIQTILEINDGNLYKAEIMAIKKSQKGSPGEMTGVIFYGQDPLGDISYNYETGIYGHYDLEKMDYLMKGMKDTSIAEGMEVAYKNEIKEGAAKILCTINGETRYYDITIDKIFLDADNINKSMKITVTDEELLALTGGIVQGMSGSPIVQNGRIVGAVTHVLINDPERGYGIFIENMLEH